MREILRVGRPADIWHKAALSAPVAFGVPALVLLACGRLDLALYTSAGSLCALYAHGEPYAARARVLGWVILGMLGGVGIALTTAALTGSVAVRVAVAALLAGAYKAVCDAARTGPPGGLIFTFITASCAFVPQRLPDVPAHLALGLLGAAAAWLVCMAPGLVRPEGPQRIAAARALEAAARLVRAREGDTGTGRARHEAAAAVNAAWCTLLRVRASTPEAMTARLALERLVVHAETVVAGAGDDPARLAAWARDLRANGPVPTPPARPGDAWELSGLAADRDAARRASGGPRRVLAALRPGSPLLPIGARVVLGAALAGWASMLLGVGRPSWAVVTAAAVFQANASLTWRRAVQRVVGNLVGLALFSALLPATRLGQLALVAAVMALQFGAEATISRNYWLGTVFVTPMALLMAELAGAQPAGRLVAERWLDTCVGAAAGLLTCALVTNRRAAGRIGAALGGLEAATSAARAADGPLESARARERLAAALVEVREAADVAAGEWWQGALPEERVERAERDGHRALATLVLGRPGTRPAAVPASGRASRHPRGPGSDSVCRVAR
ncbi:FUSC family protein [Actinomadura fibrosa]|uniref:FUSC family protein n=1 Tax=Actinomadura fibrosa TaxID=111802 RepID=A0ABW2XV08_9ACTN